MRFHFVHKYFNSTMVRLEGLNYDSDGDININFNSTMVRLEAAAPPGAAAANAFQFHYGTIRSVCR
mgnify:CR=1 FL=1